MIENSEKELLNNELNDLEKKGDSKEIKKFIEDVELMGENEDIVEMAKQKLEAILAKTETVGKTTESQTSQVESMGGTGEEVTERTKEVDSKIEEVKVETQNIIIEVQNETTSEKKEVTQEKKENLANELNIIVEKVKTEWSKYLESGDIESSLLFTQAKSNIENMIPYNHEKSQPENTQIGNVTYMAKPNPGAEKWREVMDSLNQLKEYANAKRQESLKPVVDFKEKLKSEISELTEEQANSFSDITKKAEEFKLSPVKAIEDLKELYQTKIKEYSAILEKRH